MTKWRNLRMTYDDGPQVDEDEKTEVCVSVKREEEYKQMVWNGLSITINRVESKGSPWCRDYKWER
jgi:hypothetical protein